MLRLWKEIAVERICTSILKHQVKLSLCFDHIDKLGYGIMGKLSQNINLSLQIFDFIWLIQPFLLINLDGDLVICSFVEAHPDDPISSFSQLTVNLVMTHLLLPLYWDDQVQKFALHWSFPLICLHLLHLEFVDVVRSKLVLHYIVHELGIHDLGSLLLFLEGLLCSLGIGGGSVVYLVNDLPRCWIPFFFLV